MSALHFASLALLLLPASPAAGQRPEGSRLELPFVENLGQAHPDVRFLARTSGGTAFVSRDGELVLSLAAGMGSRERVVLREAFRGGRVRGVEGVERAPTRASFFTGSDPARWRTGVPIWNAVTLGEVYPGIEVELRARGGSVEKVFRVRPGAEPASVEVAVRGARGLSVAGDGRLAVDTGSGVVHLSRPAAWQEGPGGRTPVEVAYRVCGRRYGFTVGAYDRGRELVVDPYVASFLGGAGLDRGHAIQLLQSGDTGTLYVAGQTTSFDGWPAYVVDGYRPTGPARGTEAFVARLTPDLGKLEAIAFLSGDGEDAAFAVAVGDGVYVTGSTTSSDFPEASPVGRGAGEDAFVAWLSPDLQALRASRYLGGSGNDRGEAIAAGAGGVYVAGTTKAGIPGIGGGPGFVAFLSTNLLEIQGRAAVGEAYALALGTDGVVYVAGDEPVSYTNRDLFVQALSADLRTVLGHADVGGTGPGREFGMAVAVQGEWPNETVFLVGGTTCADNDWVLPVPGPLAGCAGAQDAVVVRLEKVLVPTHALALGGPNYDRAHDVRVGPEGDALVLGWTEGGLTLNTAGGLQPAFAGGGKDLFLARVRFQFQEPYTQVVAATYLGGSGLEEILHRGLAVSGNDLFVTGLTGSDSLGLPYAGSAQPVSGGSGDGFVARLEASLGPSGDPVLEVRPLAVDFGNVAPPVEARAVSVRNAGGGLLRVTSMVFELPTPTAFRLDVAGGPLPCGSGAPHLYAGEECTVAVRFQPTGLTPPAEAHLAVASEGGNASVLLSGRSEPEIAVLPAPGGQPRLTFPATHAGSTASATFSIRNEGAIDLRVSEIVVWHPLPSDEVFALGYGSMLCAEPPFSIAPGSSCSVLVTFAPPADLGGDKVYNGTAKVVSDDRDERELIVYLSGTGVTSPPVEASDVDFGTLFVPGGVVKRYVNVTNHGPATVSLTSYSVTSAAFQENPAFDLAGSADCAGARVQNRLSAGQSCLVEIAFLPQTVGSFAAFLEIGVETVTDPPVTSTVRAALTARASGDWDWDGVPDIEECGPSGTDTAYDGNHDGHADAQQPNVASLHSYERTAYLTLSTAPGTTLVEVAAVPWPAGPPASHEAPLGAYQFTVLVPQPGDGAQVTVHLPATGLPEGSPTWLKHGNSGWYDFGGSGRVMYAAGDLTLFLRDGGAGDADGQANGRIVDPGAPAWPRQVTPPQTGGKGGCGCGVPGAAPGAWALGAAWLALLWRRRARTK